MPTKKYDWPHLKQEYIHGDWITLKDFCISKGMPEPQKNSYIAKHVSGWATDRKNAEQERMEQISTRVFEAELLDTKKVRIEQAKKARAVKQKALDYIMDAANKIRNIEEARKLYDTAAKLENEALGITEKTYRDQNNTQVIINPTPLVESLDAKGLANLLKNLGELRQQHALTAGGGSETEARPTPLVAIE